MTPEFYLEILARSNSLEKIAITDHGMAIYFPAEVAWQWKYISDSSVFDEYREFGNRRLEKQLEKLSPLKSKGILTGIETEMMHDHRLTLDSNFRDQLDVLIGSVHFLPISKKAGNTEKETLDFWLDHMEGLLETGIDILGHPFRWLSAQMDDIPLEIISRTVSNSKDKRVALELNSHIIGSDEIEIAMLREVAEQGAKIVFSTDSHRREEVGDLSYHSMMLEKAGLKKEDLKFYELP